MWTGARQRASLSSALVALLLVAPSVARAAGFDGTQNLDVFEGPVVATGRITGLGGAFTAVAEGQDGEPFNVASLAQRDRDLDQPWNWDFVLGVSVPTGTTLTTQDFDNDGVPDIDLTSRRSFQLGLSLQIRRFGLGLLVQNVSRRAAFGKQDALSVDVQDASLGAAYAFLDETLILGAELVLGNAVVQKHDSPDAEVPGPVAQVAYAGLRPRLGLLWRPRDSSFRVGAHIDVGQTARVTDRRPLEGVVLLPTSASIPAVYRLGISRWLGPNSTHYNDPSPQRVREEAALPEEKRRKFFEGMGPDRVKTPWKPVLIAADLVIIASSPNAVSVGGYLRQGGDADPVRAGAGFNIALHAGAEWEAVPSWVVIRGGSYLEPSRYGALPRPHATFGMEVKLPFWPIDLRLALAGDVAPRLENISFSIAPWRSFGPRDEVSPAEPAPPPPKPAAPQPIGPIIGAPPPAPPQR